MAPPPRLSEMIETVRTDADSEDPLAQLGTAAHTASEITDLGDQVLGYFVENARARGHSWIEISETLGVSKQAVHKRFAVGARWTPPVDRFTPRARTCVEACTSEAARLRHPYVGTEHLLLALFSAPDGIADRVLQQAGITHETVEQAVLSQVDRGTEPVPESLPFTPRAVRSFERALQRATDWGHSYIGTEHLLAGLYGDGAGMAERILTEHGLSAEAAESATIELLSGYTGQQ